MTDKLDVDSLQAYIDLCICPFCDDGRVFKVLALHVTQAHGVTAYQLRKDYGLDRKHRLCSVEHHDLKVDLSINKAIINNMRSSPRWRDTATQYTDGGQRPETIKRKSERANNPETKRKFVDRMSKLDFRSIALKTPPHIRSARGRKAAATTKRLHGADFHHNTGKIGGKISIERRLKLAPEILSAQRRKAVHTIRQRYGADFYRRIGKKAGETVKRRYGDAYYHNIGVLSARKRWNWKG